MLAAVGILLLMASCGRDSARVEICSDGSWLGDYTITGDQVDFFCTAKIKNTGSEEQKINLYGDFSEDMAGGLLKTGRLIAIRPTIPPGRCFPSCRESMPMKLSLPENMPERRSSRTACSRRWRSFPLQRRKPISPTHIKTVPAAGFCPCCGNSYVWLISRYSAHSGRGWRRPARGWRCPAGQGRSWSLPSCP